MNGESRGEYRGMEMRDIGCRNKKKKLNHVGAEKGGEMGIPKRATASVSAAE